MSYFSAGGNRYGMQQLTTRTFINLRELHIMYLRVEIHDTTDTPTRTCSYCKQSPEDVKTERFYFFQK